MIPARWAEIEELFHRAAECDPGEREGLLQDAGNRDPELRRAVEALLSSHESAAGHLWEAVRQEALAMSDTEVQDRAVGASGLGPGSAIGRYHLIQLIGAGGMGEVWLAEQKEPLRRHVAVKLIKTGMDTREVAARFESERQALALMDHPAIAKVFDAGSTPQGRPYFVMEYVSGIGITQYCDRHKLTMRQRLELFILVCEGVQHAHQKTIIHRDLKASNILVADVGGKPNPKIIDFGVAKATGQKLMAETLYTRMGAVIGTIGYMSPEQANSAGEDIDTRTDVYSLGVVLYELLVGARPFDFRTVAFDEALRRLREQDPPKPSTKLRTQGEESTSAAQNRCTDMPALIRLVRGDADAIALKALEKDRARRYATPMELARDIERYLRNQPVSARAPSIGYRTRKFAGAEHPDTLTSMNSLANSYWYQGKYAQAEALHSQILEIKRRVLGAEHPSTLASMSNLALAYRAQGKYAQAEVLYNQTLEIERRVLGPEHLATLKSANDLATIYDDEGKYAQAERLQSELLEIDRRVLGAEHLDTLISMNNLADDYYLQGRYVQAEVLLNRTLEIDRRVLGPEHPNTLNTLSDFALMYQRRGKYALAETYAAQTLAGRRHALGSEHPETIASAADLSLAYISQRKFAESEPLAREAFDFDRRKQPQDWQLFQAETLLGASLAGEKKYAEAEPLLLEGYFGLLARKNRIDVPEWYDLDRAHEWIMQLYASWGKPAKAAEWRKK